MAVAETIFASVFNRVLGKLMERDVPVSTNDAQLVAAEITREVAPIVVNATNSEEWWRSRVYIGLGAALLSFATSKFLGFTVSETDLTEIINIVLMLIEAWGLFYAWYGRKVGATKKPLGK